MAARYEAVDVFSSVFFAYAFTSSFDAVVRLWRTTKRDLHNRFACMRIWFFGIVHRILGRSMARVNERNAKKNSLHTCSYEVNSRVCVCVCARSLNSNQKYVIVERFERWSFHSFIRSRIILAAAAAAAVGFFSVQSHKIYIFFMPCTRILSFINILFVTDMQQMVLTRLFSSLVMAAEFGWTHCRSFSRMSLIHYYYIIKQQRWLRWNLFKYINMKMRYT